MSSGSAPASANSTPSSWTGSVSSDTAPEQQGLWSGIRLWWAEFSLQTKLLAIATLVVSLMMTSITFFALNGIQRDAVMNDTRYARDLGPEGAQLFSCHQFFMQNPSLSGRGTAAKDAPRLIPVQDDEAGAPAAAR